MEGEREREKNAARGAQTMYWVDEGEHEQDKWWRLTKKERVASAGVLSKRKTFTEPNKCVRFFFIQFILDHMRWENKIDSI